jgi:hypothetical protein
VVNVVISKALPPRISILAGKATVVKFVPLNAPDLIPFIPSESVREVKPLPSKAPPPISTTPPGERLLFKN